MPQEYVKHVIECKCIMPQYKNMDPPVFHKFLVFSVIAEDGSIVPSTAQCTNCGVLHRVTEVGESRILRKEDASVLMSAEDYKLKLPPKLVGILELYDVPLATWQEADFILENKMWGRGFVLKKEQDGTNVIGKYIVILGEQLYNIKQFEREV